MIDRIRTTTDNPDIIHLVQSALENDPALVIRMNLESICTQARAAIGAASIETRFRASHAEIMERAAAIMAERCSVRTAPSTSEQENKKDMSNVIPSTPA